MKKRILSIVLSIVMLVSLLPTTVLAVEASATEASWVFGASGITPDYTDAATGTLTEAFTAANANEDNTTIYVQLNKNVIAENNQYFSLGSNKSMVLDLNEKTISSSDSIYCIYTLSGSSLAVKNGTITVKETKNTGYGFFVNGALTVENCTINAEQTSSNSVYGINGRKGSSLTVKNSSITARNTENSGSAYGIYADQGTLTVEKCNISAESSNRNAYGINTSYTNASISEGTISAQTNSSSYRAYGVYSSYGSVTLSGTPGISATTADFYYPSTSNYKVVFTGTMSAPSEPYSFIGLSGYGFTSGAYLCNINANNFGDYFVSADPAEEVIYDSGELKLVSKPYVSFYTGSGTPIDRIYLPYSGGMATQPAYPTWEGYTFAGWYADDAYTTEFDFNQTITQNTKVYAKWTFAATGAEVEDSGTLNGTYGSTLDELIEATLSKLSITVTGENGASLGGFCTSNWTVKEGQELAAAQLGATVTFVGTLTAPTATNYNSDYNYWYGRLPQWEDDLVVEVDVVLDYYVKFGSYTYTTNSDGIMAYTIKTKTFDIIGYFDRNWRSTTYNNGGYETYLKVGDAVNQMNTVTSAGGGDTKLGLNVAIDFAFLNNGQTLQIKYTVNNTTEEDVTFSMGSGADVKIGSDDDALITPFDDGSGYKMVSDDYNDQSAEGDYAQFNFFGKGYAGVTDVTDFWYGGWNSGDATNGCYWTGNKNVAAFYGVAQSESLNDDSAASWHWDDSIGARETKTYSVLIGIGGAGSENAAQGGGLTEPTGSVTIEVSEELTNSNQLVVKLGNITLIEDTDYTVDLSVPDKPVITFNEAAGLNVSSGDLTVTVTFADQGTEDVIITNSIPGTGNISTEEGVLGGVTAEGLDELAKEQNQDIVLTVKEEEKNTEDVEHNAIDTAAGDKTVEFLDITLKDKNSGALITGVLSKVVEIAVPFDDDGKSNVTVYRYHDSAVNTFTMLDSKPADAEIRTDGTFFVDGENNKVYIYTNQFSTYAIGYTTPPATYTVTVTSEGNGTTSASPTSGAEGTEITLTATPATGYRFKEWQVVSGSVTISDNKFEMPASNVEIKAVFEADTPGTYTVTYLPGENDTGTQTTDTKTQGIALTLKGAIFTRTGYTQTGWATTDGGNQAYALGASYTADAPITLYPVWTANTNTAYTVEHWQQNVERTDYVKVDTDEKTGMTGAETVAAAKTYIGFTAQSFSQSTIAADGSTVVKIYYNRNTYTVTYTDNGVFLSNVTFTDVAYGSTAPAYTGNPTRTGYTFGGWYTSTDGGATLSASAYDFDTPVTGNLTLYAKWTRQVYTIKFVDEDGTELQSSEVAYGETPVYNGSTPTKAATAQYTYTFAGWTPEIAAVTGEATYTATYTSTVNKYTIKFVDEDGTELQSGEVAYGETPVYNGSTPTKAATAQYTYTFAGWTPEIAAVTGEATYTATYTSTVNEYTVIFADWNGTELDRQTVAYGNAATTPTAPTRTGHTFTGWDKTFDEIVADLTVTAQYRINQYTITFDTNGGSAVDSITQDYNTDVTAPADPTKIGYDFGGWLKDGDDFTFNSYKMGAENFTLIAKWNPANGTAYMVNHHFQNVENDEYTVEPETKHGYTDSDTAAEAKSVTGFTAGVVTQKKIAPDGTTVIDIYYTRNVHTLTFKPENGEENIVSEVKFGAAITTPDAPAKTGYTFKGWGEVAAIMPDADVTYTAGWTINQYTITFNSNGGSAVPEITQDYNTAVVQPENPTKTGYDFGGWYEDAELTTAYVFSTMPAENITVYAKWNPANGIAYTVKHYHEDVSGDGYTLYETETLRGTTNAQTAAEAKNYPGFTAQTFEQTTILPDGSAVVEIKYDRNTYIVTLVTNKGTIRSDNVTEYTYGVGAKLPTDVTRSGYRFGGWYDNEACKGTPVTEITATDIGDKTFYAKWEYIYIPIITPTYDVEIADDITGGDVSTSKKLAYRGDTITITVAPNAGYELAKLTVTDSRGNAVSVTKVNDSKYTFKMPGYDVEIDAVFAKIDTTCPGDSSCPMYGYTDLDRTLWYHDGIHYCIEHGLMVGTGTNIFEPNIATSRAMIVTILWRLEGCPIVNYAMDFEDVAADQWYTEAIRWAASEKIVEGYGNGQFGTNDAITREQMVTIMFRYAKYKGYDVSVGENTNILSYDDAFDVAEWAIPAMQWACGSGMIQGIADGNQMNLAPQGNATRAQAAAILQRFCENVAKEK